MNPIIQSVVIWIVTGVLGVASGWAASKWRDIRKRDRSLEAGVRELLLAQLESLRREMVDAGGVADDDLKGRAQRLYDAYHGMGGNGHGTALNNDIQNAPIRG